MANAPPSRDGPVAVAVIFAGGDPPHPAVVEHLPSRRLVVAADSGVEHALELGWAVDLLVGDLDSARPGSAAAVVSAGGSLERHPADKDATDLELALAAARDRGIQHAVVVGGGGGRLDHLLANLLLLASDQFASLHLEFLAGTARAVIVRDQTELRGAPGSLCSLLPLGGDAHGVRTTGLRWPLDGEDLPSGTTRGLSNEFADSRATVALDDGVLLVVQPTYLED